MDVQTLKDICFEGAKEAKQLSGEVEKEICWYEQETIPGLWIAFYIFCILWLFVAVAIICDDFFVPSLEAISGNLNFHFQRIHPKRGCVSPMVIWPAFRMGQYRVNDHPYHALQFSHRFNGIKVELTSI